jgi:glycerol-3-phosphate dehydrogenase
VAQLPDSPSVSADLHIHGFHKNIDKFGDLSIYGSDAQSIIDLMHENNAYKEKLHRNFTTVAAEVVYAVRREMARTVEDFLSRRTRALLLDARASMETAPKVAELMASELKKDDKWAANQVHHYRQLASGYLIK